MAVCKKIKNFKFIYFYLCHRYFASGYSRPAPKTRPPVEGGLECCLEVLRAGAGAVIAPVLLKQVIVAAKRLVELGSSRFPRSTANAGGCAGGLCTEIEVALIGVFLAAGIKPGIQIRIRNGFFQLV